jgi:hypothetical protein
MANFTGTSSDDVLIATSAQFVVYSASTGGIFFNANGTAAGLGSGAKFAVIQGAPLISVDSSFELIN